VTAWTLGVAGLPCGLLYTARQQPAVWRPPWQRSGGGARGGACGAVLAPVDRAGPAWVKRHASTWQSALHRR
jgi:hypothetical protein